MCGGRAACCPICPSKFRFFTFHPYPVPSPSNTLALENPSHAEAAPPVLCLEYLKPPDEVRQEAGGALSTLGNVPVLNEYPDLLGPVVVTENADVRELEPSRVNAHERGRTLPVMCAAPALAKGTASVKPAGKAEKAMAAKSEALMPRAQDAAGREVERLLREGKLMRG